MGTSFVVSVFLQDVRGYSAIKTGVIFTAATVGILISSLAAERLAKRYSQRTLIVAGFLITLAGIGLLLGMDEAEQEPDAGQRDEESRPRSASAAKCLCANRSAANDETRTPNVAAVKTTPVWIALYPRTVWRKTDTTNDVPMSSSHCMFCVTRARLQVRVPEQPG